MLLDFPLIVADESVDARIIRSLREAGYAVYAIIEEDSGISDESVILIASQKGGYLLTEDKDFGDILIYNKRGLHNAGSMLLRIFGLTTDSRNKLIITMISIHRERLLNCFAVLTSKKLRLRKYTG